MMHTLRYILLYEINYRKYTTHNQEEGCEYECLHAHIQVHGESDAKVVRIGEQLPAQAGPLFGYFADLLIIGAEYLKMREMFLLGLFFFAITGNSHKQKRTHTHPGTRSI